MGFLKTLAKGTGVMLGGSLKSGDSLTDEKQDDYQLETTQTAQDVQQQVADFNASSNQTLESAKAQATQQQTNADTTDDKLKEDYDEKKARK